jgi:hypothetical protein
MQKWRRWLAAPEARPFCSSRQVTVYALGSLAAEGELGGSGGLLNRLISGQ